MAVEYPLTSEIMKDIERVSQRIGKQINMIKELLNLEEL